MPDSKEMRMVISDLTSVRNFGEYHIKSNQLQNISLSACVIQHCNYTLASGGNWEYWCSYSLNIHADVVIKEGNTY